MHATFARHNHAAQRIVCACRSYLFSAANNDGACIHSYSKQQALLPVLMHALESIAASNGMTCIDRLPHKPCMSYSADGITTVFHAMQGHDFQCTRVGKRASECDGANDEGPG
jgi:hypothetical protein